MTRAVILASVAACGPLFDLPVADAPSYSTVGSCGDKGSMVNASRSGAICTANLVCPYDDVQCRCDAGGVLICSPRLATCPGDQDAMVNAIFGGATCAGSFACNYGADCADVGDDVRYAEETTCQCSPGNLPECYAATYDCPRMRCADSAATMIGERDSGRACGAPLSCRWQSDCAGVSVYQRIDCTCGSGTVPYCTEIWLTCGSGTGH
jgi:hypothetical protein